MLQGSNHLKTARFQLDLLRNPLRLWSDRARYKKEKTFHVLIWKKHKAQKEVSQFQTTLKYESHWPHGHFFTEEWKGNLSNRTLVRAAALMHLSYFSFSNFWPNRMFWRTEAENIQGTCDANDIRPDILTCPFSSGSSPNIAINREDCNKTQLPVNLLVVPNITHSRYQFVTTISFSTIFPRKRKAFCCVSLFVATTHCTHDR